MITEIFDAFIAGLRQTTVLEYIAVVAGILSVWFSKKENILVYPVGLINTIIYIYLSYKYDLFGEATVNIFYTVMSIWGWMVWRKKDVSNKPELHIAYSSRKDWVAQIGFFILIYIVYYVALTFARQGFSQQTLPAADSFATATAFTGMWLMVRKKVESWYWWIATNIASVPLYFVKGLVVTSVYYLVLLALAFLGLQDW
jgi:nicotinamide mononucleotide transporter